MIRYDPNEHMATTLMETPSIVNVASVPQRSPFRYPGGKTWLVPYVRRWLKSLCQPASELIEPFAGGAVIGLTAVFEDLAQRVTLVEIDKDVAAVWKTILGEDAKWLADRIVQFRISPKAVRELLASNPCTLRDRAFATIVRNRVQRGGILAPGASLMKEGENGRGVKSRWYPETLRRRILDIANIRHRIRFIDGDAFDVIRKHADEENRAFFIDPPYTIAGRRLYRNSEVDHEALFRLMKSVKGAFLMAYDDTEEIRNLASRFGFVSATVPMKSTHHARMTELLISRDLNWIRIPAQYLLLAP